MKLDYKTTYVPILKAKQGELSALNDSPADILSKITPLLDIPDIPFDYETEEYKKTPADHINATIKSIYKNVKGKKFYLDFSSDLFEEESLDGNPIKLMEDEHYANLNFIPVTGLNRTLNYQLAVNKVANDKELGCAIRIVYDLEGEDAIEPTTDDFDTTLNQLSLQPENVDLILDLGSIYKQEVNTVYWATRLLLSEIPYIERWRNLIVSASSFPGSLGPIKKESMGRIPRVEWLSWLLLYKNQDKVKRMPIFSDYSISHPNIADIDPRMMNVTAGIRYTSEKEWLIIRGKALKQKDGYKYSQFKELCGDLITTNDYDRYGKEYTKGDGFIFTCATNPESTTGNLTTWRRVGNDHHFKVVVEQLASLIDK